MLKIGEFSTLARISIRTLRHYDELGLLRLRPAGPPREIFLHVSAPVTRDDESNVTEIQVPVSKN